MESRLQEIKDKVKRFYGTLFHWDGLVGQECILSLFQLRVTSFLVDELMRPYYDAEIKRALFQMPLNKSPRQDAFFSLFFQKYWHIVGLDVTSTVRQVLVMRSILH